MFPAAGCGNYQKCAPAQTAAQITMTAHKATMTPRNSGSDVGSRCVFIAAFPTLRRVTASCDPWPKSCWPPPALEETHLRRLSLNRMNVAAVIAPKKIYRWSGCGTFNCILEHQNAATSRTRLRMDMVRFHGVLGSEETQSRQTVTIKRAACVPNAPANST